MNQGINLLKKQTSKEVKLLDLARNLKVGSFVFLIFYCLIVLAIFSFSIYLQKLSEKNFSETEAKKRKITELKKAELLQITLKQRLSSSTDLMVKGGPYYEESLNQLEEVLESGVTFQEINFGEADLVGISGKAQHAVVLAGFLEKLSEKSIFSRIILSSLTRQKDGGYLFNLDLKIGG